MAFVSLSLLLTAACLQEYLQLSMCLPLLCPGVGEVWFFCSADGELRHRETLQLIVKRGLGRTSDSLVHLVLRGLFFQGSALPGREDLPLEPLLAIPKAEQVYSQPHFRQSHL